MTHKRLVLVLTLLLTAVLLAAPAWSASSAGAPPRYDSSFLKASALDLIRGDERGLRPNYPITRAEFATVVVRMLGQEGTAQAVSGVATPFADAPADHWASGYINVAYSLDIVRGTTPSAFEPERWISHAEAATMLVRALGKEHLVTGAWPLGYLVTADDLGMLADTTLSPDRPISRAEVARYIDNCLETPQDTKTPGGWVTVPDRTILARLGFAQRAGRLSDADPDKGTIALDGTTFDLDPRVAVYGGNLPALRGHAVQLLVRADGSHVVYVGATDLRTR